MANYRIYVEKKEQFQVEANALKEELNLNLNLNLKHLRLINIYDLFGFTKELLEKSKYRVFGETVTDYVLDSLDLNNKKYLAVEFLPGQFDQRAASAIDCIKLLDPNAKINIRSGKLLIFDENLIIEDLNKIEKYYINTVEARKKDLNHLSDLEENEIKSVKLLTGFRSLKEHQLKAYCKDMGLAMNDSDLACVVSYFIKENRDPYEIELRILDTYWSDHCRHTTFQTILTDITIDESFMKSELEESLNLYYKVKEELSSKSKDLCLMDLACIGAKYLKKIGKLQDLEESEENNACSIYVTIDVDGKNETWLLQFKNETHNHPTEIEPFGGASTCLGGAIRDPLSGRAYVYQAMRVTGAGDIYKDVKDTLNGKLPQKMISMKAAQGYSSYGNQFGLATTHVREIYHENYVAKRLEVGAVVGAVKASYVRRQRPNPSDVVLLLGGRTGRDGIGGATGSSKEHTVHSIEVCSSEVQKGNAPEERKIAHLFQRPEVIQLIKKSNDFGAGGVSVAIGELADGLQIDLDKIPTKYNGLNATELAISESQERMAVVVEQKDVAQFEEYCKEENIEVSRVAVVTKEPRLVMFYHKKKLVDIHRDFIDSAGAKHYAKAHIESVENKNPFIMQKQPLRNRIIDTLTDKNVVSQKGLIEMFDASIGCSTVLMPFGGKTQRTETQVSVQKLPVKDQYTNSASILSFGYNPYLSSYSPYHGAMYAMVESISKVVAAGGDYQNIHFSFQEYFEKMNCKESWGKPLASLLGALKMQLDFGLASIGGKDSMSGTFGDLNVPPMLMAFGVSLANANQIISPELKGSSNYLYLIHHKENDNYTPNTNVLKQNYNFITQNIKEKKIISAYALGFGGVIEAISKMSFGNEIGFQISYDEERLNALNYGSILVESTEVLNYPNAIFLGKTIKEKKGIFNEVEFDLNDLYILNTEKFEKIYKSTVKNQCLMKEVEICKEKIIPLKNKDEVVAFIPVFPGTNCDYDTAKAFKRAGAKISTFVFKNLTSEDVLNSIIEMSKKIDAADILVLSGGFSAGDEPDGSGKFIANVLNESLVKNAIERLLKRKGLILGICNGFQALIKSGLLPYGKLGSITKDSPTLFRNDINRHVSMIVSTKLMTTKSPWFSSFNGGEVFDIAVSHGEGKFVCNEEVLNHLIMNHQIAFQYVDLNGKPTEVAPYNPNGSDCAIEGIISEDGLILGKMGHTERYEENIFKNIYGNKEQNIFKNAVDYFKK
ncbi:MAG: phosphoribosylformylglycinamidine synthase [Anaeroplasmataceae bacterium]|nr:phosphoribosylformylglycinamidine synthase [Anaeroplasmataceae bacterium]